jgi:hypothetical protein
MTAAGAKSFAKLMHDTSANPPVFAAVHSNGPKHNHVVHITFGEPKPVSKYDSKGNALSAKMPKRPRPYTVS